MFTASDARAITPSQADIAFNKDLQTNFEIIKGSAGCGARKAVLYDGGNRSRMIATLQSAGYTVFDPVSGCLRAQW